MDDSSRRSRTRRSRLGALLAGLLAPLALWASLPMLSDGATPQRSAGDLQRKIDATQGRIGKRKAREGVLTTQISAFTSRIDRLQRRQSTAQAELDTRRSELFTTQAELREQRRRQLRLRARLHEARVALAQRLVELYRADAPDLVTVILSSKGFADLLERGDFMERISDQDQKIIAIVAVARRDAIDTADRLSVLERRQQQLTATVQGRRDEIVSLKQDVAGARGGKQRLLDGVRAERRQLEGALSGLKAQQAKIQAALQRSAGTLPAGAIKRGNGSMIWPVNGPITSPFCERRAWEACHPGIDIGVPAGTPIRAAAAGRVALLQSVGASGGYGNFTCVQHSGALSTCYAHQSRFAVSLGQTVSQGQVIGYSGCTGLCFGDHLHFEVRVNGAVMNPLNYL